MDARFQVSAPAWEIFRPPISIHSQELNDGRRCHQLNIFLNKMGLIESQEKLRRGFVTFDPFEESHVMPHQEFKFLAEIRYTRGARERDQEH